MENPFYYVCMHSGKNNHKINLEKKIIQVSWILLKVVPKMIKVIPRMIKGSIYIIKKDSTWMVECSIFDQKMNEILIIFR